MSETEQPQSVSADRRGELDALKPVRVASALEFLQRRGVWHIITRNSRSTSCKDAASRRVRLGSVGIPLFDELKTMLCLAESSRGQTVAVLVHCRAHEQVDLSAVQRVLELDTLPRRASRDELASFPSIEYGTVNPFSEAKNFVQVFDEGVLDKYTAPHTMMTNVGEFTWAVEFKASDLLRALCEEGVNVKVGGITARELRRAHRLPSFGIVTGNGPDSGMALWRGLNGEIHRRLEAGQRMRGDLSYPKVVLHSLPEMGLSMELASRAEEVWVELEQAVSSMLQAGVSHVTLACNTTPYFDDRIRALCAQHNATFVSVVDALEDVVMRSEVKEATLLAIPPVAEMGEWSCFSRFRDRGFVPVGATVTDAVQELGYLMKRLDSNNADTRALNKLQHILRSGVTTTWVVIALTEISILLARFPKLQNSIGGRQVLDTLRILSQSLADIYLAALPSEAALTDDDWS